MTRPPARRPPRVATRCVAGRACSAPAPAGVYAETQLADHGCTTAARRRPAPDDRRGRPATTPPSPTTRCRRLHRRRRRQRRCAAIQQPAASARRRGLRRLPAASGRATRSRRRSRASTSTWPRRSPRRSSATRTRSQLHRHLGRRPDPSCCRTSSVDIVVRNMTMNCARWQRDRLLLRVLPVGPEDPRHEEPTRRPALADLAGKKVCAPTGTTSLTARAEHGRGRSRSCAADAHRLPGAASSRARSTPSPVTTRCSPGSSPRTPTPYVPTDAAAHLRALRPRRQQGPDVDLVALRQPRARTRVKADGAGRPATTGGSPTTSARRPPRRSPVYGRG